MEQEKKKYMYMGVYSTNNILYKKASATDAVHLHLPVKYKAKTGIYFRTDCETTLKHSCCQAEEIIAKEQTGFRAEKNTTQWIFNFRILCFL